MALSEYGMVVGPSFHFVGGFHSWKCSLEIGGSHAQILIMETRMVGAAYRCAGADVLDGTHHAMNKFEARTIFDKKSGGMTVQSDI